MYNKNPLLCTDVYKMFHMRGYPEGTTKIYSYLCARSVKKSTHALFFGLQYYLQQYLSKAVTLDNANEFFEYHESIVGPVPGDVREKILRLVEIGHIPLEIKAVPEGTIINNQNVLMTVSNTHDDFAWVVGFFESLLLKVWNTTSVATASLKYKKLVTRLAKETSDNESLIPFLVHDFGYRGCSSEETAELSGAAHLINFVGTDTIPAVKLLKDHYLGTGLIGASVPASEHSVMCAYGKEGEFKAFGRMLDLNPSGFVSIVSDSYDFWNVLTGFAPLLKDRILSREGRVVFRPDSGDPFKIICGDKEAPVGSPEFKGAIRILDEVFGSSKNAKGFIELNPKIGIIYGDGMYYERFESILEELKSMGYATTNLVIGIGGLLLQQHNRDDLGFAFKATYGVINGVAVELFKDPATDHSKRSHKGLLMLGQNESGDYFTKDQCSKEEEESTLLRPVYLNGVITQQTLEEIRERAAR